MFKRLRNLFYYWFPKPLPTGMAQFNTWVADIVRYSGLPDNNSTRNLAASFIIQVPFGVTRISIRTLSDKLCRAASYQVAQEVIRKIIDEKAVKEIPQGKSSTPAISLVPKTEG